jgi:hypothetical protein
MLPPLANQPIVPGTVPTREHHEFLMGLYRSIAANQEAIANLQAASGHYETLGPFTRPDLAGTGTAALQVMFATSGTAFQLGTVDPVAPRAGRVVGLHLIANDARTAGTATARVRINGSPTAFAADAVQLNGTTTQRDSALVAYSSGLAFNAGNTLGIEVVTSGWTPTTADFVGWLTVKYDAF